MDCILSMHSQWILLSTFLPFAAVRIPVRVFVWTYFFSVLWDRYLGVELVGHMVTPCLPFWGTVLQSGNTISHSQQQRLSVPTSPHFLPAPVIIWMILTVLVSVTLNLSVVLICISLMTSNVEHFFHGLVCMSYLEKIYSDPLPIFSWVICLSIITFNSSLYVLHINLLYIICQYFLLFCIPLFLFLDIIISSTKVFKFWCSLIYLFFLLFLVVLVLYLSKHSLIKGHKDSCPYVLKSFIVLVVRLNSLIHFEFIFVCGVRQKFKSILLPVDSQFSQHHLLKRPVFINWIVLGYSSKINWC